MEVPVPSEPRDLDKIVVGSKGSAIVALKWLKPPSGSPAYYRVEVATSPFFVADGRVIERDQLVSMEFNASDLRPEFISGGFGPLLSQAKRAIGAIRRSLWLRLKGQALKLLFQI